MKPRSLSFLADVSRVLCIALMTSAFAAPLAARAQQMAHCDIEPDGDIDRDDVAAIFAARNEPASGPTDPRDPDGNQVMDVNDARICTLRCTLPQCAPPAPNRAPLAHAGADQAVLTGATVTLNGSASNDPDGDALTFHWTLRDRPSGSQAGLDDPTSVMPRFVADADGRYEIDLIVNDGRVDSAIDTVVVTTIPANTAPVANAGSDRDALVGEPVVLDGSLSSDVDGDTLAFVWAFESQPSGSTATLTNADTVQATFVPDSIGTYVARLTVNDGRGGTASDTVEIRTVAANRAPQANAGEDQSVAVGDLVTLDGSASTDPDSDPLQYRWSFVSRPSGSGATLHDENTPTPSFTVDRAGDFVVQLIVNDGALDSEPDTVLVSSSNTPPVANAGNDVTAEVGEAVVLDGSASHDANGDALSFFWSIVARPNSSNAELASELTPTPRLTVDEAGLYVVQLIVNDGTIDSAPDSVLITVEGTPNRAPITGTDSHVVPFETSVVLDVLVNDSDPDGDPLVIDSVTGPVAGDASIEGQSIRYTPRAGYTGPDNFQYTVSDGRGGTSNGLVSITVAPPPGTVTISVSDEIARELGPDPGAFTIERTGAVSEPLTVFYTIIGTATNGVDYRAIDESVTIPAGAANVDVVIEPIPDALNEGPESVTLWIQARPEYYVGGAAIASISIVDSVVVSISAPDAQASEADLSPATILVTRSGDTSQPLNVSVTVSGTANQLGQIDATLEGLVAGSLIVIPAGASTASLTITPVRDNIVEGTEELTVTLRPSAGYVPAEEDSVTIAIADDPPIVTIAATDANAAEAGRDQGTFTFTRSGGNVAAPLTVFCAYSGTAQNSSDFDFVGCTATIPADELSGALTITPRPDNAVEGDETVIATLTVPTDNRYMIGSPSSATITIADDPVLITIVASDASASEAGPDSGVFTFTRSGGNLAQAIQVLLTRGGTASNGLDYVSLPVTIAIAANQTEATLTVTPVDDTLVEGTEVVELTVRPAQSYIVVAPGSASVSIADND